MPYFNIVAATSENTVVTEYEPVKARSNSYQSEGELEKEFIRMLIQQGYEYLQIHTEKDLTTNLRNQLERLNAYRFSETEWDRFFKNSIANQNEGILIRKIFTTTFYRLSISTLLERLTEQSMITDMMLQFS